MWYPSGTGRTQKLLEQMIFDGHEVQVIEKFGGPPETRTPDPLIKSRATPRTSAYMRRQDPSIPSVRSPTSSVLNEVDRLQHTDKRRTLATRIARRRADTQSARPPKALLLQALSARLSVNCPSLLHGDGNGKTDKVSMVRPCPL